MLAGVSGGGALLRASYGTRAVSRRRSCGCWGIVSGPVLGLVCGTPQFDGGGGCKGFHKDSLAASLQTFTDQIEQGPSYSNLRHMTNAHEIWAEIVQALMKFARSWSNQDSKCLNLAVCPMISAERWHA